MAEAEQARVREEGDEAAHVVRSQIYRALDSPVNVVGTHWKVESRSGP